MAFSQSPSLSTNPKIIKNYLIFKAHCNDCVERPDKVHIENKRSCGCIFEGFAKENNLQSNIATKDNLDQKEVDNLEESPLLKCIVQSAGDRKKVFEAEGKRV